MQIIPLSSQCIFKNVIMFNFCQHSTIRKANILELLWLEAFPVTVKVKWEREGYVTKEQGQKVIT